jgi:carbamoyl-phosphate synthase large subunit
MPQDKTIKSILIIGSGPIVIGQACEFDYSGSQAARSLKEEGIEVTLINSNPATIMTDKVTAANIYLLPLTTQSIVKILEERQIDAVLPTMGGQTALNLCIKADEMGIWKKYGVKIIGVDIAAIEITENREAFKPISNSQFIFRRQRGGTKNRVSPGDPSVIYPWWHRSIFCSYQRRIRCCTYKRLACLSNP